MNILITGAWQQAKEHIEEIEELGHTVLFLQQEKDPLSCDLSWPEYIICNGLFLYHPIEQFINLNTIQLTSAGYDRIPMDYIKTHNIRIHNARGVYSIPMAEFAVAGVLNIYKHLNDFKTQQQAHTWQKHRDLQELNGKTVIIVGCGSVGTECAKRFWAFGCSVIGLDMVPREDPYYTTIQPMKELDRLLGMADILILTLPLTEETKGLINRERLEKLKKTAILVNIARGAIVDQKVLEAWNGKAILDVFEEEPLRKDSPLWDREDWIITPHNSFVGDNEKRLQKLIVNNLKAIEGRIEHE